MGLTQVECMEIDINSGFRNVVNQEVNEVLTNLQTQDCDIIRVSQPIVNGRKVYITVEYMDNKVKLDGDDSGVGVRTTS